MDLLQKRRIIGNGSQLFKQSGIFDTSVFDDLTHSVLQKVLRQGVKDQRIDENGFRLIKSAHQIFPLRQIYGNFSADGRVYLGQKRSRNLYKRDPS